MRLIREYSDVVILSLRLSQVQIRAMQVEYDLARQTASPQL